MDLYVVRIHGSFLAGPFLTHFGADCALNKIKNEAPPWHKEHYDCHVKIDTLRWHEREQMRFDAGIYQRPCWDGVEEFTRSILYQKHNVHVSTNDPTMLAYTPDDKYGDADRQVAMKPGRYLAKYFNYLGSKRITSLSHWFVSGQRPPLLDKAAGLKFTADEDEAEWVYCNGPTSCMDGRHDFDIHPARVYATDDVCVAYMLAGTVDKRVAARAVVNKRDKTYGRLYPTADNWSDDDYASYSESQSVREDFEAALKAAGYTRRSSFLDGCRINRIKYDGCYYVMPYVDGDFRAELCGDDKYILLRSCCGDSNTGSTRGFIHEDDLDDEDVLVCACCEAHISDSDAIRVVTGVSRDGTGIRYAELWCEDCVNDNTFYCDALSERVSDDVGSISAANGNTYNQAYADEHMAVSDFDDEWYHNEDIVTVTTADGDERWSTDQAHSRAFECPVLSNDPQRDTAWFSHDMASRRYTTFQGSPARLSVELDNLDSDEFAAVLRCCGLTEDDITYIPPRCDLTEELPLIQAA